MDESKLKATVTAAEDALNRLQQARDRNDQNAVGAALADLKRELQNVGAMIGMGGSTTPVIDPSSVSAKKYIGWRVLHKAEGGYDKNPLNMPEVIPPINSVSISMTKEIQLMSFELMQRFNPAITNQLWRKIHSWDRAFNNFTGFDDKKKPVRDFINGLDLDAPLPKYDKAQRLCGGQFVRGIVRDDKLICQPGIHGIDANKSMPPIQTIIDNNWYLYAITLYDPVTKVDHFPQGKGGPVVIPFIFDREIQFSLSWLTPWESDQLPDPLKMYK